MSLLEWIIFLPFFTAIVFLFLPSHNRSLLRWFALGSTLLVFLLSLKLILCFDINSGQLQFVKKVPWIPALGANYSIAIDGISLILILLTTFLWPISILAGWSAIEKSLKGYLISLLLLETCVLGVFVAQDALLFYLFWESMLIPMSLLIGIWGSGNRIYAAIKFFLYTLLGGVFLLLGFILCVWIHYRTTGELSLSLANFHNLTQLTPYATLIFIFLSLGFLIKVPVWPFHTWLPDAHTEAPTAGSIILAGVLLKMGVYGFIRISIPAFPEVAVQLSPYIVTLSLIGVIFAGLVAMVQEDVKRLVAYSSVAHMGYVMIGLFSGHKEGITGSVMQMVIHGINTGLLFLLIGFIYERRHTRLIAELNGLAVSIPRYSTVFAIAVFASIALPGTNGFVGEFLCLVGAFQYEPLVGFIAALGVIVSAMYLLLVNQKVLFGKPSADNTGLADMNIREWVAVLPMVALIFWIGLYPHPFFKLIEKSIEVFLGVWP